MILPKNFVRKLWLDGRLGHSTYLMFFLIFTNFILIFYNFMLDGNEIFENTISNLWIFVIIFVISYITVSIIIGRWHRHNQVSIDQAVWYNQNPMWAKMIRSLLDAQTGKASEEELEEFRDLMLKIEKQDINEF